MMKISRWIALLTLCLPTPACANEPLWRDADLIFQDSESVQSEAVRIASRSNYSHMGVIHMTAKGPIVIEAIGPVVETPLSVFIKRGKGKHYAIYRMKNLAPADAAKIIRAAEQDRGKPYDIFFRPDSDEIYCSELAHRAFAAAGIKLGVEERFGSLNIQSKPVKALFMSRWRDHPDCRIKAKNAEACWTLMQNQQIVTPVSIARDAKVEQIFSNF